MKKVWFIATMILSMHLHAQVNIIPQPVELKMPETAGSFTITAKTPIILEGSGLENSCVRKSDPQSLTKSHEVF